MKGSTLYCPKCRKTFPANSNQTNCPQDNTWLEELGSLANTTIQDKYMLVEELGSGGFGTVYLAQHLELGSRFAVKVLSEEHCKNMRHIERFKKESYTLARLDHPGIVKVIDCGLSPRPYIIMEFAQGKLLSELLKERSRLPEADVYSIFRLLAQTLSYAHDLKIVHRDIKPENIMVRTLSQDLEVKLLDFGIARLIDQDLILEETGEAPGTPQYMSPEQFESGAVPSAKSDIYSLGCVIYQCLTGRSPFNAKTFIEWSSVHKHVGPIFTDSDRFAKTGKDLCGIILNCLAKDPDERPSAKQLLEQLKKVQVGPNQVSTKTEDIKEKLSDLRSNPRLIALCVLPVLLIVGALSLSMIGARKQEKIKLVQERKAEDKSDLISSISAGITVHKTSTSQAQLNSNAASTLEIYAPEQANSIVLVIQSAKSMRMIPIYKTWAQRGPIVAVTELNQKDISAKKLEELANSAIKAVSKRKEFASEPGSSVVLVCQGIELDKALFATRSLSANEGSNSVMTVAGLIVIDPALSEKADLNPKQLHSATFPVFYVLDADQDEKIRSQIARQCQKAFTFAAGKQMYYNSNRVSLSASPAYTDEQVLRALIAGFIDATLAGDKTKETYLFSHKAESAVGSSAELRFR